MLVGVFESNVVLEEELGLLRLLNHPLDVFYTVQKFGSPLDLFILLEVVHAVVLGVLFRLGGLTLVYFLEIFINVIFIV